MANNNYSITFKSLRAGTVYTVNIGGGTGAAIPLKGGAEPFVTQEDDTDDMFTPIRTQSGYVRIVDDGMDANGDAWDWKDLIPSTDTSRPVTLTAGGTTLWQGFMQAQDFGSRLYGNPQVREFPVQCVLSVTEGSDINYAQTEIQNFAYLLKQIVDSIPSACRPQNFYVQGGADAQSMLLTCIDWQNFVSDGSDYGLSARFSMYECLEDMCRFWGWTCRTHGTSLYLSSADDGGSWLKLSYSQLTAMSEGTTSGTIDSFASVALAGDIFASTDNRDLLRRGCRKAVVVGDGNAATESVMYCFPPKVEKEMTDGGAYRDGEVIYTQDITSFVSALLTGECVGGKATFNKMLTGGAGSFGTQTASAGWQEHDVIKIKDDYSGSALASLETVYHHSYYDTTVPNGGFDSGGLQLNFDVYRNGERFADFDSHGIGQRHIYVRIGIGKDRNTALWYGGSGNTWSTVPTDIAVRVGDEKPSSSMLTVNTNHSGMMGKLFVDFLGSDDIPAVNGKRRFEIVDFEVVFSRRAYAWLFYKNSRADQRRYTASNQSQMTDEETVDCIFASDNNLQFGYGVLLNADGTQLVGLKYGSSQTLTHPEQRLANRIARYGGTAKRCLQVELRSDSTTMPTPENKVTIDGSTMYAVAISREWRDDKTQLTLLEL